MKKVVGLGYDEFQFSGAEIVLHPLGDGLPRPVLNAHTTGHVPCQVIDEITGQHLLCPYLSDMILTLVVVEELAKVDVAEFWRAEHLIESVFHAVNGLFVGHCVKLGDVASQQHLHVDTVLMDMQVLGNLVTVIAVCRYKGTKKRANNVIISLIFIKKYQ